MTATAIAITIIIVAVVVVLALFGGAELRRRRLRRRFGPEYERTVEAADTRRGAERELADRERRHAELPLRALPADARQRYSTEWYGVQELFVDAPAEAVGDADRLVHAVMADRGYPTNGYEEQVADLSVEHAATLDSYRNAHDISVRAADGTATTEDLRQAMVHYRALFEDLLGEQVQISPGDRATHRT